MKKSVRRMVVASVPLALAAVILFGPRVRLDTARRERQIPENVDQGPRDLESGIPELRPRLVKAIRWAGTPRQWPRRWTTGSTMFGKRGRSDGGPETE